MLQFLTLCYDTWGCKTGITLKCNIQHSAEQQQTQTQWSWWAHHVHLLYVVRSMILPSGAKLSVAVPNCPLTWYVYVTITSHSHTLLLQYQTVLWHGTPTSPSHHTHIHYCCSTRLSFDTVRLRHHHMTAHFYSSKTSVEVKTWHFITDTVNSHVSVHYIRTLSFRSHLPCADLSLYLLTVNNCYSVSLSQVR